MADQELEALVGHLFVVDGRSISAASPGAVAMPPPRRHARGRDTDTFFGLIGLLNEQRESASFYEEAVNTTAEAYFNTSGSVTASLRSAVQALNENMIEQNRRRQEKLAVGLACAVLREQELMLAISGPGRAFLVTADGIQRLPDDDEAADALPLGEDHDPDIRFYRQEVNTGDFLILADASLNHLHDDTIAHALESGEVDTSIIHLRGVTGASAAAEVIKFVNPLEENEVDQPPRRLPQVPALNVFGGSDSGQDDAPPARATITPSPAVSPLDSESADDIESDDLPEPAPEPATVRVDATEPPPVPPTGNAFASFTRGISRRMSLAFAGAAGSTREFVNRIMPEEEHANPLVGRFQLSVTMQVGVAVSVAVLVALVTTAVYRFRGATSQYAQLVREAQTEIEEARTAGENQAEARPHWELSIFLLDQAAEIRDPSAEIWALRREALDALDSYDHVTRVDPVLLRAYDSSSFLHGPIVQGINVYVVDETADVLYREDLNESGTGLSNRESTVITQKGGVIENQVIGGLIDLVWMEEGGVAQRNVLAVLSRDQAGNGMLITYSPSWDVHVATLPASNAWGTPRAIAVYDRDLYILDSGVNEIWRYEAGADAYATAPQRYFTDFVPDLSDAIDMAIDSNGNVYVLHSGGYITKYFFGRPEEFEFESLPQPVAQPTAFFLNVSPFDRAFLIADRGGARIYSTALTGAFLRNYKDAENTVFGAVSGVTNTDQPAHIYLTAGNGLYYFPRP